VTEVAASVVIPRPRSAVRRFLIRRWVDADRIGVATARVLAGAGIHSGRAQQVLPAFDAEVSRTEGASSTEGPHAFEVEAYRVLWRYVLAAVDKDTTRLEMTWIQSNWVGRLPGIRSFMAWGMRRETARLARWADSR
jgi:hypothetical protein